MTEQPYSDDDLRAEAVRQHAAFTEAPDFVGVGEQMSDQEVIPGGGVAWGDFSDETFERAQRSIHDLIAKAVDLSEWAVNLGADGLEPAISDTISLKAEDRTLVRIHVAFERGMPEDLRRQFIGALDESINELF
jgi:hypothetical protein